MRDNRTYAGLRPGYVLVSIPAQHSGSRAYLEGQGDLVSRLIMEIIGATIGLIRGISILTKSP